MTQTKQKATTDLEFKPPVTAQGGALTFTDIESLQRLSRYLLASRMMPKQYDTMEKIGTGIQYAIQVGFKHNWLMALRQIAVINGTPSLFGDLPLALVRNSGLLEEFDEWLYDKDHQRICIDNKNTTADFIGAACRIKRKGFPADTKVFTVQDAKTAGVWGKNVWLPYPKRMIQMRMRSIILKDQFADILNGMSIGEYDHNTIIERFVDSEVSEGQGGLSGADRLNAMAAAGNEIPLEVKDPEILPAEESANHSSPTDDHLEDGEFGAFNETRVGE